jgi:hypothetical protein
MPAVVVVASLCAAALTTALGPDTDAGAHGAAIGPDPDRNPTSASAISGRPERLRCMEPDHLQIVDARPTHPCLEEIDMPFATQLLAAGLRALAMSPQFAKQ